MKYMLLFMSPPATEGTEPGAECDFEEWVVYAKELNDSGVWVSGHALQDLTTATTVQVGPDGERTVTDGPFADAREVLGGYEIIDVPNLDVALEWAARSPGARYGGWVQVRPVADL